MVIRQTEHLDYDINRDNVSMKDQANENNTTTTVTVTANATDVVIDNRPCLNHDIKANGTILDDQNPIPPFDCDIDWNTVPLISKLPPSSSALPPISPPNSDNNNSNIKKGNTTTTAKTITKSVPVVVVDNKIIKESGSIDIDTRGKCRSLKWPIPHVFESPKQDRLPTTITEGSPLVESNVDHHRNCDEMKRDINVGRNREGIVKKCDTNMIANESIIMQNDDKPCLPVELQYDEKRVGPIEDEFRETLVENADLSSKLKNGWTILPHQKGGVLKGLLMRRLILAYDMGLGKTLIGCIWGKAFVRTFEHCVIYVMCPVSLKGEWSRTAYEATGLICENEGTKKVKEKKDKTKKTDGDDGKQSKHVIRNTPELQIFSWAKIPSDVPRDVSQFVVIGDEAHSLQSMESLRTKRFLKLVESERCIGVMLLTGTPMKNGKPSNLFPLLRAVHHPFGDNQKAFEINFCNGHQACFGNNRVVWNANGSSNLELLNAHSKSHLLYKTKEECLKELPPKSRQYKVVPVSSRHELQYSNAMNELAKALKDNIDTKDNAQERILGIFTKVRQVAAYAKVDATVAIANKLLEKESSIVIFSFFVGVAKVVHKKLGDLGWNGELLSGETLAKKRQGMVDNFQSGVSPVFVCTFGAGGVGITLTAARTIILLDRPWTPGDALQAEDRVRRIGQTRPVVSIWMRAFEVDLQIDNLIEQKNNNSKTVVGVKQSSGTNHNAAPKVSIWKLVQSMVSTNKDTLRGLLKVDPTNIKT